MNILIAVSEKEINSLDEKGIIKIFQRSSLTTREISALVNKLLMEVLEK